MSAELDGISSWEIALQATLTAIFCFDLDGISCSRWYLVIVVDIALQSLKTIIEMCPKRRNVADASLRRSFD